MTPGQGSQSLGTGKLTGQVGLIGRHQALQSPSIRGTWSLSLNLRNQFHQRPDVIQIHFAVSAAGLGRSRLQHGRHRQDEHLD